MPSPLIRNIWAVGRNYADHAKELGNAVPAAAGEPMIFLKAGSSAVFDGARFRLPKFTRDIHHEVEVAFRFGRDFAFDQLTLAIDLTAREVQNQLKAKGHPWSLAKSFKDSCLFGPMLPLASAGSGDLAFTLRINGELRQSGQTRDMIHSAESLRIYILERFPVVEGDWLLTGTPAGVAQVHSGDRLEAEIPGLLKASWEAVSE